MALPPATSTFPSFSNVAVGKLRALVILPVAVKVLRLIVTRYSTFPVSVIC